jgi:CRISPR/Cas system-associated protein Cas5 (RAMP superfamily)
MRPRNHDFPFAEKTQAGVRHHEKRRLREPLRRLREREATPQRDEMTELRKKIEPLKLSKSTLPEELEKFESAMLKAKKAERQGEMFGDEDHDRKAEASDCR